MSQMDEIFNEFARAFVGVIKTDREIAFPDRLDREALDGSLESLKIVDSYLGFLHANRATIGSLPWETTILWGGVYAGEVIRHSAPGFFRWVDDNDYMPAHPNFQRIIPERTVATCAFLVANDGSMSMALNKIARAIEEGPENSVHFFAVSDIRKSTPQ